MTWSKIKTVAKAIADGCDTLESVSRRTGVPETEIRKMIENGWVSL